LDLKRLLASTCRQKILEVLSHVGQTYMMDLVRRLNSDYTQVSRNVAIFAKEGVVTIIACGRMKIIRLNREKPKTVALLKALEILRKQELLEKRSNAPLHAVE
jgi:predicted transcriptional regulator